MKCRHRLVPAEVGSNHARLGGVAITLPRLSPTSHAQDPAHSYEPHSHTPRIRFFGCSFIGAVRCRGDIPVVFGSCEPHGASRCNGLPRSHALACAHAAVALVCLRDTIRLLCTRVALSNFRRCGGTLHVSHLRPAVLIVSSLGPAEIPSPAAAAAAAAAAIPQMRTHTLAYDNLPCLRAGALACVSLASFVCTLSVVGFVRWRTVRCSAGVYHIYASLVFNCRNRWAHM